MVQAGSQIKQLIEVVMKVILQRHKGKIVGTAALFFVAMIILVIFYVHNNRVRGGMDSNLRHLTIALPHAEKIQRFDPNHLSSATDYNFVRALYSPLVEYENNNQISGAVADEFYWDGGYLIFHIKKGIITVDGYEINASDAYYSLKRLMIAGSNMHGDLYAIFCNEKKLTNLDDPCSGISYDDEKRLLKLKPKHKSPLVISLFTSIDFVIIPKSSFNNSNLIITDYKNTSGPYYYEGKDSNGNLILLSNSKHWHTSSKSPTKITVINDRLKENNEPLSYELFVSGVIDALPTFNLWGIEYYTRAEKLDSQVFLHRTKPIAMSNFQWTEIGRKISVPLRRRVGQLIQNNLQTMFNSINEGKSQDQIEYHLTNQFFPKNAYGSLSDEQVLEGQSLMDPNFQIPNNLELSIYVDKGIRAKMKKIQEDLPFKLKYLPKEQKALADLYYSNQDISYEEDVSLVSFCLSYGSFNATDNKIWIRDFFKEDNVANRVKMLKELHYRSVFEDPSVIPILYKSYKAISQNGWKMNFARHWARSPYWQYSKED